MPESGWVDRSIGDCLESSFAGEWGAEPNPGNAVVLRATDIDDEGHVVGGGATRSIPKTKLRAKQLQHGDILLEGSGGGPDKPVGRVALFDADANSAPAICSNFFKTLRPKRSVVNERFLWRKLGWFYNQPALLALQQQTTGIINLKFSEYLDARFEVPVELPEQTKIAQILDALDTTICQTEAIIEKLKQVKQGLLHDLLTRGIDANGELRPAQSEAPHLYKESVLGWIPREWEARRLEELLSGDDPAMRSGPFGSALLKSELVKSGLPLLGIDNVHVERFVSDFTRFVTEKKFNELSRYAVRPYDLMITIMGTVGRCCLVPEDVGRALSSKHTWTITLDKAKYSPLLAMLQINYSPWVLRQFAKDEQGGIMAAIRSETLRTLSLPTPSIDEQLEIETRMRAVSDRIDIESAVFRKLLLEKAGLMDDLLTGRVRVTPLA
jgi:type I restriction enzyme S subunit